MEKVQNDIEEFVCQQCGECCRGSGFVAVTSEDAQRIARYLNITVGTFLKTYTQQITPEQHWLKNKENLDCIFLKGSFCIVHPVKPAQCKGFPLSWRSSSLTRTCPALKLT